MPGRFSKDHLWQLAGGERAFERREEYIEAECIPWTYWRHQLLKQVEFCSFRAFSAFTATLPTEVARSPPLS